jgi:hypothetical protein
MMEKIKENGVLIGVAIFVLVIIGFIFMDGSSSKNVHNGKEGDQPLVVEGVKATSFIGSFKTGVKDEVVSYAFDMPVSASSSVEDAGAYIVSTIAANPFTKIYFSDEREKAETPVDYLNTVIAPQVKGFALGTVVKIGDTSWQTAESVSMEWHVAPILSGNWLVMVESYKKDHDEVVKLLTSMNVSSGVNVKNESAKVAATSTEVIPLVEGESAN